MAYFQVEDGGVIEANHMNAVINQGAIPFANETERTTASLNPHRGMLTYLQDPGRYDTWSGTAWTPLLSASATYSFADAAARTAAIASPYKGMLTYLQDVNRYDTWNGTAWLPLLSAVTEYKTDTGSAFGQILTGNFQPNYLAPGILSGLDTTSWAAGGLGWGYAFTIPRAGLWSLEWTCQQSFALENGGVPATLHTSIGTTTSNYGLRRASAVLHDNGFGGCTIAYRGKLPAGQRLGFMMMHSSAAPAQVLNFITTQYWGG